MSNLMAVFFHHAEPYNSERHAKIGNGLGLLLPMIESIVRMCDLKRQPF